VFSESLIEQEKVSSLDLKTDRESLMRTVCGSEFQTAGAENRKARLNSWSSSGMADECSVWLQAHSVIRQFRETGVDVLITLHQTLHIHHTMSMHSVSDYSKLRVYAHNCQSLAGMCNWVKARVSKM